MRGRVPIGIDEFGMPIMKQIRAKSEYEFMIKAGQMMLAAGLLGDYVLRGEETSVVKPVEKIPFKAVAERWYKVYKEDNETLKPSTKADYRRMLDKVIYPVLGDKGIDEITTTQLQEMLNEHRDMASTSQTKLLITLRQIFDVAIQEQLITVNPAKGKLTKTGRRKNGCMFRNVCRICRSRIDCLRL